MPTLFTKIEEVILALLNSKIIIKSSNSMNVYINRWVHEVIIGLVVWVACYSPLLTATFRSNFDKFGNRMSFD